MGKLATYYVYLVFFYICEQLKFGFDRLTGRELSLEHKIKWDGQLESLG